MRPYLILLIVSGFLAVGIAAQAVEESTLADQKKIEVTVYNSNRGLVKDTRTIGLSNGEGELRFMDVAAFIMPVTVHIKSLSAPEEFTVLEQNYEYDLMDYNKLLDKYVGKPIKLLDVNQYQDRKDTIDAVLLSNNNDQPVFKINNEIYLGHGGYRVLPEIPENLIAKPTLTWQYANQSKAKDQEIEVSYLTDNINWQADYVMVLNQDDTLGDLSGWVTVDNHSGATYTNAKLKLVAGQVNQVQEEFAKVSRMGMTMDAMAPRASGFQEEGFFEYHIYDLQRPTTIKQNQTKQISLLGAFGASIQKEILVYGAQTYYNRQYNEENIKQPVLVKVKFKNSEENKLGMPLPKGIVRMYKKDSKDNLQFIGEDRIEHTPKNEEVTLKVGEAFDIVAERKQTDFKQVTSRIYENEWEISLRNRKEEPVKVGLIEPVPGTWSVLSRSHPFTKVDAFTIRFDVPVGADEEVKVKYRIRVEY